MELNVLFGSKCNTTGHKCYNVRYLNFLAAKLHTCVCVCLCSVCAHVYISFLHACNYSMLACYICM